MFTRPGAPLDRNIALRQNILVLHLRRHLGFEHQDTIVGFSYKIGLIFEMVVTAAIIHLELPLCRPQPFQRLAFEDNGQLALRVRMKLRYRREALREPAEQIPRHIALVGGRHPEIERGFA